MPDPSTSRRLWHALETVHAVTYFAPEVVDGLASTGLHGFWMGYFAARSAPLGPVPVAVVDALFYNFHPDRVRRALPDAWLLAGPEAALAARLHGVDQALWRLIENDLRSPDVVAASLAARRAAEAADCGGRALGAAYQALEWPTVPHLVLWHACTVLREHRGDGHVAALVAAGVDGLECHVLAAADGRVTGEGQRKARGWSDDEWDAAVERLRRAKRLTKSGELSPSGRKLVRGIEGVTDARSAAPYAALRVDELDRLIVVAERLAAKIARAGGVPFPNPMGLTRTVA